MEIPAIIVLVVAAGLVFDATNGFHDAANAIATVVTTKVLTYRHAVIMAAVMNLLGALIATKVAQTIENGLVDHATQAIPTTLIGCLPTYAAAGLWAPALLVVLRLLQGLSVGGEFTGSACFLVENAPAGRRTFFGSWATVGVAVGVLLGSGLVCIRNGSSSFTRNSFSWKRYVGWKVEIR